MGNFSSQQAKTNDNTDLTKDKFSVVGSFMGLPLIEHCNPFLERAAGPLHPASRSAQFSCQEARLHGLYLAGADEQMHGHRPQQS